MSPRRRFAWCVTAVCCLAVAVRWFVILRYFRDLPLGFTDNFWYHRSANLLADGHGIVNPFAAEDAMIIKTAGHPPLYIVYLAAWSLLGADTALWHRLASGLISAAAVVPVAATVNRLAGRRGGALAALAVAVLPQFWMNDGLILSESLYIPLAATALWQAHRTASNPSRAQVAALGVILATAALTRSEAGLLLLLLMVPLASRLRDLSLSRRLRMAVLAVSVATAVLAPWVIRNLVLFEEPVLLTTGAGYVLEFGNCDDTYSGEFLGYWSIGCDRGDWPEGDETVVGAHKLAIARDYIEDHLDEQPKVVAARVGRLFGVFRPFQNADFDVFFERRLNGAVKSAVWINWLVCAAAVAGAVVMRRRRFTLLPCGALIAASAAAAAISFGITRYRVSADVAMIVLAAVALGAALDRWRPSSSDDSPTVRTAVTDAADTAAADTAADTAAVNGMER